MNKILVTTDFSTNSRAGIRFALQLASQNGYELILYHSIELLKPTSWSAGRYTEYAANEIKRHQRMLGQFVSLIYQKNKNLPPVKYQCVSEIGPEFDSQVISYAKKIKADYICITTHGAGKIRKLFGTHASTLITTSPVPVIVVPRTYRIKPVTTVWYASDLENLGRELMAVNRFTEPLKARLEVIHYNYPVLLEENKGPFAKIQAKYSSENIQFHFKKLNIELPLTENIQRDLKKEKPSLLVLFTNQKRSWFDRLLMPSGAAELTFDFQTPMLVFRKN